MVAAAVWQGRLPDGEYARDLKEPESDLSPGLHQKIVGDGMPFPPHAFHPVRTAERLLPATRFRNTGGVRWSAKRKYRAAVQTDQDIPEPKHPCSRSSSFVQWPAASLRQMDRPARCGCICCPPRSEGQKFLAIAQSPGGLRIGN